jgi:type II secretory pathway component PulM
MTRPDPVLYDQHTRPLHARIAELEAELEQLREALQAVVDTPRGRDGDMRAIAAQALRERALRGKN